MAIPAAIRHSRIRVDATGGLIRHGGEHGYKGGVCLASLILAAAGWSATRHFFRPRCVLAAKLFVPGQAGLAARARIEGAADRRRHEPAPFPAHPASAAWLPLGQGELARRGL